MSYFSEFWANLCSSLDLSSQRWICLTNGLLSTLIGFRHPWSRCKYFHSIREDHAELKPSRMGWDWALPFMPYGNLWRAHRRVFNQYFNQTTSESYTPIQEQELLKFLRALLVRPQDFMPLTRLCVFDLQNSPFVSEGDLAAHLGLRYSRLYMVLK